MTKPMTLAPSPPKDQLLPALFLDRDGVINVDHGYVSEIEKFELVPGIVDAIRRFNERNWRVIVATNQSGIARAFYTEKDMFTLHAHMESELADAGARIDAIYHCPFHEEGEIEEYRRDSELRKPRREGLRLALGQVEVGSSGERLLYLRGEASAGQIGGVAELPMKRHSAGMLLHG